MVRTRFDAVFFDVGNTLLYPYPSVARVCERVLLSAGHIRTLQEIEAVLPLVDEYYEDRYRADDSFWTNDEGAHGVWIGMYSLLCRSLGVPEPEASASAAAIYHQFGHHSSWRAYADVAPAFERLRRQGMLVGIISNWDTRLEGIFDGLALSPMVDTIVCSAVVGIHKPDTRIFELACERIGVAASRCAHVGDHYDADVAGAMSAGMMPLLIDRHGVGLSVEGVRCLGTLDDLEDALG